jgi:hypothetical protein
LEKITTNKRFDEQWSLKQCGEVGDALHLAIKANLLLVATIYHTPFYRFASHVYKCNMHLTIMKCKVQQDGQDASHIALIEPSSVYKGFTTSFPIN